jgi:hypothetical protein
MNRIAKLLVSIILAALSATGCKRANVQSNCSVNDDDGLPKYVIVDGEELVVPARGRINGIETGIKLTFPRGYTSEILKGLDFYIYYYHAPLNRGTIALYLGDFPNYIANPDKPEIFQRKFGQLNTTFRNVRLNNGFYADALVPSYFTQGMSDDERMAAGVIDQRFLHIMITTNNKTYLAACRTSLFQL